jgi:signal transduction histidine kinase
MTDIQSGDKERMHWENIFITSKEGNKKVINAVNIPLFDQNTMVSTVTDITDLYNTQSDLIKAKEKAEEADRLKTAFLANMSHEIRTPMNGILGFTELLADSHFTGEEKKDFINIIRRSGQRMLNTVNDLIDISKIETGQMQVVLTETNLREQIFNLYNFFKPEASEKSLDFRLVEDINPMQALVRTDVAKLDSIMTNLIKNALKYTDSGFVEIRVLLTDNQFTFCVSDSGIGIPEERKHAIFNRFEQADIEDSRALQGSGLGLAITRAYVEMLGGTIKLESELGKGSEFSVSIPVDGISGQKVSDTTPVKSDVQPSKPHLKILIAEDDPVGDQYLTILLSELKADVLHAINGQDAVEICRENGDIDLVMMDIRMPVMDGYEATRQIREFNREVVIIAQTAFALSGDREKALESGCNDYISKPIKKDELIQIILKYI